jgi:ribulokinase/ribulose-phosphate 3-epimerase
MKCIMPVGLLLVVYVSLGLSGPSLIEVSPLVLGVDLGTESVRMGFFTKEGTLVSTSSAVYRTSYPSAGHVEQNPADWWSCMASACKEALASADIDPVRIIGLSVDTTACSVVLLDESFSPLRPCILYNDARSADQSERIIEQGRGDPALDVCNAGRGPISAEWMIPKCLWVKERDPKLWKAARYICEKNDYINYMLTGEYVASSCNVAARWNWNAEEAMKSGANPLAGRPVSLLRRLEMEDLLDKWPQRCVAMGQRVGLLTEAAARHLGLPRDIPVTQAGPDAYVGMVGLGCIHPGQMSLITGSTHLHLCVGGVQHFHTGMWGTYAGAPLPGLCFAEGGQSSTGSMLAWARRLLGNDVALSYAELDTEAALVEEGCDGLLCLETFQGARTPQTDPLARGALVGLSLAHTRGHIWRALLEAVCFGTRRCLEAMADAGLDSNEIHMAGGATRSDIWLQMHADIVGKPVVVGEFDNSPLLGSAVLAAVGAGIFSSVEAAVAAMVRTSKRVLPNPSKKAKYDRVYKLYCDLVGAVAPISHALASRSFKDPETQSSTIRSDSVVIMPSILAADFAALGAECLACWSAGCTWLHVDIFDGSPICSESFSFGPSTVAALHRTCPGMKLDTHIATAHPYSVLKGLVEAGASRITFQYEMFNSTAQALAFMEAVQALGVECAICLAPSTQVEAVEELLNAKDKGGQLLLNAVTVLAVTPGIGGQKFNHRMLEKITRLRSMLDAAISIVVDGGINTETAAACIQAGASTLVVGTGVFGRNRLSGLDDGETLKANIQKILNSIS